MKLLVTGGLGFIGSNFVLKLLRESNDFEITNIDAELFGADHKNLHEIKNSEKYHFEKGNISNKKFMEEQITKCDAVINFAAESFVDRSINDANPFLVSNIRGAPAKKPRSSVATISAMVATEDLGFFAPGEGPRAVDEGRTALDGDHPINSSGGLKAKGHPVGASGVGQVIEIYHQLRGETGERQVKKANPTVGLTHNVGGTGGTCVVNVLRRES